MTEQSVILAYLMDDDMVREIKPEKKTNLMETALKLFAQNGVQHTSTAEIAKTAGVAAGTLFLYFPTKQSLVDALVLKIGRDHTDFIKSLLGASLPVRDTFLVIWNGSIQWFLENMDAYLYNQQVRDTGIVSESAVRESSQFFDYYYMAIQRGFSEGCIKPYPIELIGNILYQDIVAMMNLIRLQTDPSLRELSIRQGFDIFWNGIKSEEINKMETK